MMQAPIVANHILTFFQQDHNNEVIEALLTAGVKPQNPEKRELSGLPLSGNTYVLTGTLDKLKRNDAKEQLESLGAKVSGSISKNTTTLFAGEKAGSKLAKAEKLGVPVLDENELIKLLKKLQADA